MALEDVDLLDSAMDAAEAQMLDTEEPVADTTSDAVEEPVSIQERVTARDETGKFTKAQSSKPQQSVKAEPELDQVPNEEVVETDGAEASMSIETPHFWSAERKALFSKAQPELQKVILEAERERNDFVNRKVAEADRGIQIEKRANEVFEPYRLKLQANGLRSPLDAAERLLAWNEIFEQDVVIGIKDLMTKNGLSPYDLLEEAQTEARQYSQDPRVEEALEAAREAKELAQQQRQYIEQQTQQAGLAQIEAFKNAPDKTGQARGHYFEFYKPQIINAMQEILAARPHMPEIDALTTAYDFVIGEVRSAFGSNPQAAPTQAKSAANVQKAKIAASSITGAPANGAVSAKVKAKTIEEAMDIAEEQMASRR